MPRRWLFKTEPGDYAFADLERDGGTVWDGVGNNLALKHLRSVKPGDEAVIYHTGKERSAIGLAKVTSAPYPDPERDDERYVVVDIEPVRRLAAPVTLKQVKAEPDLAAWELVRIGRLSVMPMTAPQWKRLRRLAGERD
jgi:predicted RNA-binding protein with PUA-like domain